MHEVGAWVRRPLSPQPMEILRSPLAAPGWDAELAELEWKRLGRIVQGSNPPKTANLNRSMTRVSIMISLTS